MVNHRRTLPPFDYLTATLGNSLESQSIPIMHNPPSSLPVSNFAPSCGGNSQNRLNPASSLSPARDTNSDTNDWRQESEALRRQRARIVVAITRLLRNHRPHDVLTQVPENNGWREKLLSLALKLESLMFRAATSLESYVDEQTLFSRVELFSRHLVRIRKRKNALATAQSSIKV